MISDKPAILNRSDFRLRVEAFRWIGGVYLLVLGISFFLLPQGTLGIWLQPIWFYAACSALAGFTLLWLSVLKLPASLTITLSIAAAIPLFIMAAVYVTRGALVAAILIGLLAIGIVWSGFFPEDKAKSGYQPDLLGMILGTALAAQGADLLLRPETGSYIPPALGISALGLGTFWLCGGLAVVIVQLVPGVPAALRWLVHIACGVSVIGMQLAVAIFIDPLYWILGTAAFLRGAGLILLPILSERFGRVRRNAFRPRLSLALFTAALIPIMIGFPLLLSTLDEQLVGRNNARSFAFGMTLLLAAGAALSGWLLASSLTKSLVGIVEGVDRIANGDFKAALPVPDTMELADLTQSVTQMADALDTRFQERDLMIRALLMIAEAFVESSSGDGHQVSGDLTNTTKNLLKAICSALRCEGAMLFVFEPGTTIISDVILSGLEGVDEESYAAVRRGQDITQRIADPAVAAEFLDGKIKLFDLTKLPYRETRPRPDLERSIFVPMQLEHRLMGALSLYLPRGLSNYSENEKVVAAAGTNLMALLLERERLLIEREEASTRADTVQEVNRQMDSFIGIVSHELKNPITSIKGNLQLAERRLARMFEAADTRAALLTETQELLTRARRQLDVQNRLVDDLVDVSRLRTDHLELRLERCDLVQLVHETVQDQRIMTPERTIQLEVPAVEIPIMADPGRVVQVINNYLSNALKYSEAARPVEVRVSVEQTSARVAVRDEGPGLSPEAQTHIWEQFYRAPGVTVKTGSGVGLGLGLHICKRLIESQGGQVGVESSPGAGSTFWFTLPLAV